MMLVFLLLAQDAPLRYAFEKGASRDVSAEITLGLSLTGNPTTVDFFRSMSPFFSFEKIHLRADGRRLVPGPGRMRVEYLEGRVDGRYDDENYEYDFAMARPPADLEKNKLKQMLWFVFAGGKTYQLTDRGEFTSEDKDQDATGEVLDLFFLGITRFPDKPAAEWEAKFQTKRVQKDNQGRFAIVQKSKLEKLDGGRVRVVSSFTGTLVLPKDAKTDPNLIKSESTVEGTITILFEKGEVVSSEGSGKVRFYYKGSDPNGGDDHEIEVVMTAESKIEPRRP